MPESPDSNRISGEDFLAIAPEAPWDLTAWKQLTTRLDAWAAESMNRLEGHYACRQGCHHCCQRIGSLLPVEWAALHEAGAAAIVSDSGLESTLHPGEALCSLLGANGNCRNYSDRPVICRTHGHALLLHEDASDTVDFCPMNFTELVELDEDDLIDLDRLHEDLLRANALFLKTSYPSSLEQLWPLRVEWHKD
jgi:uncharacterized protein